MKPRPWITDGRSALLIGWALFVAGALVLYDAYDRRGRNPRWPLGAILPF